MNREKGPNRRGRVAHALRDQLSALVDSQIKDPRAQRAGLVSVNHVELNRDRTVAYVYVSFLSVDDAAIAEAMSGLEAAAGYLRGPLGRKMRLARTPQLRFVHDTSPDFRAKLEVIRSEDAAKAARRDARDAGDSGVPEQDCEPAASDAVQRTQDSEGED